ncbi:bifunctional protein FolC [Neokomagataea thailandica NBRC 106555]|uniref:Dihydrofolate synthase/folylpolyglutamate synthase n=2 Tax=Neokomagataea TaxID=1223423 RepID=A0A4Y6V353_9PROT|nr:MULTISPECIES: folylpolyglutamate synthase/dihydrofolate synthase family protein [Neokomagataea]QDH24469.1 bifunctional folylpolyglutamate synthase/dihydrofolate synthase [Neokomagataea tanensis]GBR55023.1 bifunctional protein FolC [Neokomagataea thailandica NBRC 106555]
MADLGAPAVLASEYRGRPGAVLERLQVLYPKLIDLSLGRLETLLARLGNPERHLPPVIHVAGTNGKGSTCANLRAIAEHAGLRVHVMTSPHLVDVTERFRVAGRLVTEDVLVNVLEEVERINDGAPITVFEVLTAAGFLLFSRYPADLVVLEVGLGGRLDASNVIPAPRACVITPVSLDHQAFLGDTLAAIAGEKAGIIKRGVPVVVAPQEPEALAVIRAKAEEMGSDFFVLGQDFSVSAERSGLVYSDAFGELILPKPGLLGPHQSLNSAVAVATLRYAGIGLPDEAYGGIAQAIWPARLQTLKGALAQSLPDGWELILDGGHNPGAGAVLAEVMSQWQDGPIHIIAGVKQSKDVRGFLEPLLAHAASVWAVSEDGQHMASSVDDIIVASGGVARSGPTVRAALQAIVEQAKQSAGQDSVLPARVLICGSLYLAGVVLQQDGWLAQ